MKRVLLIVFSGTGNTLLAARMIADAFSEQGIVADILDITGDDQTAPDFRAYDLIGLGYPIYAFNTPIFFLRYIKKLRLEGKRVFIFKTSGEPLGWNNASSAELKRFLGKRSCTFAGEYHFLMPYNIICRFPDNLVKQMYLYAERYSRWVCADLLRDGGSFIPYGWGLRLFARVLRIQRLGAALNGKLYRVNTRKCTYCLKCVRYCPSHNIRQEGKRFRFGFDCQMCMRCSFSCPTDAISIGILNPWKVNGPYPFETLAADPALDGKFTGTAAGAAGAEPEKKLPNPFYKIFIPYFSRLDRLFAEGREQ
ncbi:EFR1 family ferrodoxin [Treponema sp. OttesenSCG-928-L16]|nr:EFR1 family ferrodoxin [Treponema sp. OttesenSCG-928-L16]